MPACLRIHLLGDQAQHAQGLEVGGERCRAAACQDQGVSAAARRRRLFTPPRLLSGELCEPFARLREFLQRLQSLANAQVQAASDLRAAAGGGRHSLVLAGCSPTPLASYLKALGVLRLVAEQVDSDARGHWAQNRFVLVTSLSVRELIEFFQRDYEPTPLVAPWGARSGFFSGPSEKTARDALKAIEESPSRRLQSFRDGIVLTRSLLKEFGFSAKAKDEEGKLRLLRVCRAYYPEHMLAWLDTCYVLTEDTRRFPPLLGTGGNEGSGSYVSGFAQQVVACLIDRTQDHGLSPALFGTPGVKVMSGQTPGQFAPDAAGGYNAGTGFQRRVLMNPWDYLLCLEGTLLFASAATRRLESLERGELSYPFTVHVTASGTGGVTLADEAKARERAELWAPLWERSIGYEELKSLLAEGRATLGRRKPKDGLDFVRAVSSLGVDRGISEFQRYGFFQRYGDNVFAVPMGRIPVVRNPATELIDQLERNQFLDRFRQFARSASHHAQSMTRRLEDAIFRLMQYATAPKQRPAHVQAVIEALGDIVL